jgi:transcriptional regulator with XRE-family HTH domain
MSYRESGTRQKVADYLMAELERRGRKFSQAQFAALIGTNTATMTRLLNAVSDMTLETKIGIAMGLRNPKIFEIAGYDGLSPEIAELISIMPDLNDDERSKVMDTLKEIRETKQSIA